ncbi:sigma-70 family RNA polymerase sigma factor [Streptomyces sp. NPDC007991]|uniref:sigma-70 family RNA polymerase sigma factor n=1 Tax=Streptomyces sp. NPDC007991 TaxID=3364803 RepID=UPI0036E49D23
MSSSVADPLRTRSATAVPEPSSEHLDALMRELWEQPAGPRRSALRDQVIRLLLPMTRRVARRFGRHGEDYDDLVQVACLGLVKAVDGYDPTLGHAFLSYALPKVTGELRRHLRDRTSAVRLPRPLQEASGQVFQAVEELQQRLGGCSPPPRQIAEHTGLEHRQVLATLRAVHECRTRSLEEPAGHDQYSPLAWLIGAEDAALGRVVDTVALTSLVRRLPERDRHVLYLRFYRELTQQQIADVIGVSQMQVSRILRRCLDRLREGLLPAEPLSGRGGDERRPVADRVARPATSSGRRQPVPARPACAEPARPAAGPAVRANPGPAGPGPDKSRASGRRGRLAHLVAGTWCGLARRSVRGLPLRTCRRLGAPVPARVRRRTCPRTMRGAPTARRAAAVRATCPGAVARPPPATVLARRRFHSHLLRRVTLESAGQSGHQGW